MASNDEIYPLSRDLNESNRLNKQHAIIMEMFGGPIDKSVPLNTVSTIADAGTGTGIWIKAAQELLKDIPSDNLRYYHGFDISNAQFPSDSENATFSVQDVLKPFPALHLASYDLVHVRLLCAAIKEVEFKDVAANLMTLLKPGGHLQWVEMDSTSFLEDMEAGPEKSRYAELLKPLYRYKQAFGLSEQAQESAQRACEEAGFVNIATHSSGIFQHPHLKPVWPRWQVETFSSMMPTIFGKLHQVPSSDATEMARSWLNELGNLADNGSILGGTFYSTICQKPLAFTEETR